MQAAALLATGLAAGLLAGTASCTAVQGGLLVGLTDRRPSGPEPDRPVAARMVIGWFLLGRFAAHTALGALLGWLGAAVQPPPAVRAALLVAAGAAVVVFAVRLLRGPRHACDRAPRRLGRAPDRLGRAHPLALAGSLGAATVLVPCGVTLGVEMVAVTGASAAGGAAVMAGFVAGSAPAFALLGYVLRRVSHTRVARLAGVVALAAGLWTAGSGLNLGGWLPGATTPAGAVTGEEAPGTGPVTVWATRDGFRPGLVRARAGVPVEIVFRLADPGGCTRTVTIEGRDVPLPATVRLPPRPPGTLRYVCAMGMYTGFINFS
ncbi:sulfite exporter TauE/SafE family protein [Nonomuraea sp. NPDC050383]|uniref:urease accessory protein UreH domain-containing protein n=1 Tax=Nonomuraea sp. NPDC050383 TaxID=3364362 RepID=UPI00379C8AE5